MSPPSLAYSKRAGVLYLSYDGMLEPLGQSKVLAYLAQFAIEREIHLFSFEKREDWIVQDEREWIGARIRVAVIHWHLLRFHRRPSSVATAYHIAVRSILALYLVVRFRLRIIRASSYVASTIALVLTRLAGAKFIFDMRGLWADERLDGGLWPRDGFMYRLAKRFEGRFLRSTSQVVSLTQTALVEDRRVSSFARRASGLHGKLNLRGSADVPAGRRALERVRAEVCWVGGDLVSLRCIRPVFRRVSRLDPRRKVARSQSRGARIHPAMPGRSVRAPGYLRSPRRAALRGPSTDGQFAMPRKLVDAKSLILGEGEQRPWLEALIEDLGLSGDAFMPGFSETPTPYFVRADLHVLSFAGEGFGNFIVETLEQGTPLVSTDCRSGPREVLNNGRFGSLVPIGDPDASAAEMVEALGTWHDRDALRARAQNFSVDKAANAYLDFLLPDWRGVDQV